MATKPRLFGALVVAAFASTPARADTVTLKNGRELHGKLLDESKASIRLRIEGGGTITVLKADIATFMEGEVLVTYSKPQTDAAPVVTQTTPGGTTPTPPGGGAATPPPAGTPTTPAAAPAWVWPATLTPAEIAELTPIRDAVLKQLEELGPSAEERLKALETSAAERTRIQEVMARFRDRQRQGSANARRGVARDEVVGFGAKGIDALVDGLGSESQWTRRVSAQALGALSGGAQEVTAKDMRWLMIHQSVPQKLLALLADQGEVDSPFVRADANAALEAISGAKQQWPETTDRMRTPGESQAAEAWSKWWATERRRFDRAQESYATNRAALEAKVGLLRQGKNPNRSE
jgi:hypothetical protein